jgi:transcriptional regulator with XRE-family HTH domain
MLMAVEETFEWTEAMILVAELARIVRNRGGLTADERSDLAKRFGVNEGLLLRYESARSTFNAEIFDKQWALARLEVIRRRNKLGIDLLSPGFGEEISQAYHRILDALPEPEKALTRELDEAADAIRAALDASTSTPEK